LRLTAVPRMGAYQNRRHAPVETGLMMSSNFAMVGFVAFVDIHRDGARYVLHNEWKANASLSTGIGSEYFRHGIRIKAMVSASLWRCLAEARVGGSSGNRTIH
jgi:hypothetical protein